MDNLEFVADALSTYSEKAIINQFHTWIRGLTHVPRFIHWSCAEPSQHRAACTRHCITAPEMTYVDLMKVFIDTPLTVKGCLNFKLKNITKALHANGLIQSNYDDLECTNGVDAMVLCWQHYGMIHKDVEFEVKPMDSIIKYNRIDTKVLYDIHELF